MVWQRQHVHERLVHFSIQLRWIRGWGQLCNPLCARNHLARLVNIVLKTEKNWNTLKWKWVRIPIWVDTMIYGNNTMNQCDWFQPPTVVLPQTRIAIYILKECIDCINRTIWMIICKQTKEWNSTHHYLQFSRQ